MTKIEAAQISVARYLLPPWPLAGAVSAAVVVGIRYPVAVFGRGRRRTRMRPKAVAGVGGSNLDGSQRLPCAVHS